MKIKLLENVQLGLTFCRAGASIEIDEVNGSTLLKLGKAVDPAAKIAKAEPVKKATIKNAIDRVDELCSNYTVPELKKIYEDVTGSKPHHNMREAKLAEAIAKAEIETGK